MLNSSLFKRRREKKFCRFVFVLFHSEEEEERIRKRKKDFFFLFIHSFFFVSWIIGLFFVFVLFFCFFVSSSIVPGIYMPEEALSLGNDPSAVVPRVWFPVHVVLKVSVRVVVLEVGEVGQILLLPPALAEKERVVGPVAELRLGAVELGTVIANPKLAWPPLVCTDATTTTRGERVCERE